MVSRRVLFVCALCVLWSTAVVAADALLETAAEEAEIKAGEGITAGFEALSWQRAVLNNATDLLSAMEEVSSNITEAQAAANSITDPVLKITAVAAVEKLKRWVNDARTAALEVKNVRGTSVKERNKIQKMHEVDEKAETAAEVVREVGGTPDAIQKANELRAVAAETTGLWEKTVQQSQAQLEAAGRAVSAASTAVREAEAAERAMRDELSVEASNVKQAVANAKALLHKSARKANELKTTTQALKEKAVVAKNTYQSVVAKADALLAALREAAKKKEEAEKLRKQQEAQRRKEEEEAEKRKKEEEAEKLRKQQEAEKRKKEEEERLKKLCSCDGSSLAAFHLTAPFLSLLACAVAAMVAV